ncbi:cytochrome P450 [Byssothecium circinans]|uniref:Cytochrome P450 n=1 Tax=Byssothecium circinans TaxID=147558 RepID=A0A6A5T8G1_9PLEO|nr:cytochrome P450 [Byssothecium circinans]
MYQVHTGDMDRVQRSLHRKYGPVVRIAPNEVSSASAADIPHIYRLSDPLLKTDFYPIWGAPQISKQPDTFTCIDEKEHTRYRRIVAPVYSLANVLRHEDYVGKCTALFLERMAEFADRKVRVDIGEWCQMYAFDVVGELSFGNMFGFMEKGIDVGGWIAALDALMPVLCVAAIAPSYYRPLIMGSAILSPTVFKALKSFEGIHTAAVEVVKKRVQEINAGTADRIDMLQQFTKIAREKGAQVNFTDSEVTLEAYVAMLAGSDTTAVALRASLYFLMKHPGKLAKCREEIDAHKATLSSPIRYTESIAQLPYTSAAIKEAMRLFPSVGISMQRHSPATGVTLSGYYIPPGWRVGCNPCIVHYDTTVFGDDADEYRPERWLESDTRSKEMEKSLLTFGSGTRVCIGKNISLTEIHTLVPEILRHFDISMAHDRPWKTEDYWFHKQTDIIVDIRRRA